jgi:glutathione S-transferase
MARIAKRIPLLLELCARGAKRRGVAAYLASARRLPFNEEGIFRHYPELDAPAKSGPSKRAPRRRS